jgi:hypothetical protein
MAGPCTIITLESEKVRRSLPMSMSVEQIVEEIKTLSPEEQQRLRDRLTEVTPPSRKTDERLAELEVQRRLVEAGILREIKVTIRGKPLSETIIEERR